MPLVVGETTTFRTLLLRLKAWVAGFGSVGDALLLVDTAASARTVLGAGATGGPMFVTGTAASGRTVLGLGTAAVKNTGASGDAVPLLNVINTWSATQVFATATPGGSPLTLLLSENGAVQGVTNLWHNTASPAANDGIWTQYMLAQDSAANITVYASLDSAIVDPTNGSEDGQLSVGTVLAGAYAQRLGVRGGLYMAGATGGDKGSGTINATGVYDDGVLLSCYPFDAALDGTVSPEKWDGKVPARHWPAEYEVTPVLDKDGAITSYQRRVAKAARIEPRQHDGARKFAARLGTEYDPLDIDKYAAHWRQKRHLTSLPNEANYNPAKPLSTGEWLQRLVETVEIQAIHIARLNDRVKVLEGR